MNAIAAPRRPDGEHVRFNSSGAEIAALFVHANIKRAPVLIVSHGAGESKENYLEMSGCLARQGISSLLLDMHGHGQSAGPAHHVVMRDWVADIQAALDYLEARDDVDPTKLAAFGLSSGGTAILEAAVIDPRLRALVVLDGTVMNTLPLGVKLGMGLLCIVGHLKRLLTGNDLRISILGLLDEVALASDPEVNARLRRDPGKLKAFANFPLPGAAEAFFVNTIERVHAITCPTLVIWGEDDELDPVSTGEVLCKKLTCIKRLEVVAGNGHAGHLDRNREQVFQLTSKWILDHLT